MLFDKGFGNAKSICHIVGAADFDSAAFCPRPGDYLIAADGGASHLKALQIEPDITLGDFDSLGYTPRGALVLPKEKDDTDVFFAVKLALKKGFDAYILHGCYGKRPDHTLANIQVLAHMSRAGKKAYMPADGWMISAITDASMEFEKRSSGLISVFSASETACGVNISGLKYLLNDFDMSADMPVGVSNEFIGKESMISVRKGTIIIMWELGDEADGR